MLYPEMDLEQIYDRFDYLEIADYEAECMLAINVEDTNHRQAANCPRGPTRARGSRLFQPTSSFETVGSPLPNSCHGEGTVVLHVAVRRRSGKSGRCLPIPRSVSSLLADNGMNLTQVSKC